PASTAMDTVASAPATEYATWETDSGMTGLTLPGMIDEPACRAGRLISPRPACGPEDSRRRSLAIFDNFRALRFSAPEKVMNTPVSEVDSTRSPAVTRSSPVISRRCLITASLYPTGALIEV